ncbi:MAG: HAMP domain-containing protein, partial [Chloroflexi bacterium]|nr:HAMP domain-containing protein [Chloroflexota bacterium]
YASAFFLTGAALIALMYLYLGQVINHHLSVRADIADRTLQHLSPEAHDALRAQFQRARDDTLNTMLIASLILVGAVGVIAGGLGWLLAGRALRPLRQITATARRVAERSLHERIALAGPNDEIKDLADTLDAMLERLDRSFDSQRRFVGNASHELRTPLTINRTLIEVALANPQANESLRQLGTTLLAVNQRHERLIDGLLTLASSEQRVTNSVAVDLADIARRVVTESHPTIQNAGVDIRADLQPASAHGDPLLLERLTQNLIDNALRYNVPEHGWIAVTTGVIDGGVQLSVENTGPRVPPNEVSSLFEPFRRLAGTERLADSARAPVTRGAGLGLSIVRAVAHAHGGDVHASAREGGGLTVRVRIPVASHAV